MPKAKVKTKIKKKTKASAKTREKTRVKTAKAKDKTKKASQVKTKHKAKTKAGEFNETQREALLTWIAKIVNLHKGQNGGLKSLSGIDEILNKYNQRYTEIGEKFDAITKFGMEKDPRVTHEHFYVNIEGRDKNVNELYILLANIIKDKINFNDAKEKMKSIYDKSVAGNKD